ncbi:proline-rich protein 1 [Ziziphus jujuba]|uniref:Proline-rich protein 1 n=2 Tax=Ziziphus jujuba TaxID=326968 RepID=A0A6P3ZVA8_ZIZJJ|nr:proline-rich protein 1 [Ziziphus jujuba]KAH7537597.1 hypothetical protein FEM48_Zijuj03G0109800 [Ziziphus jujuba var. spinosa]
MARSQFIILFSSFLLLPLAFTFTAAYDDVPTKPVEKKIEVVVEGIVYCQSCDKFGSWSLSGADPIPSAKLSVICKRHDEEVTFYKVFETDDNGYFYAPLEGFKMVNSLVDHPLQSCHVKLVSSPRKNCDLLSNVNYGLNGSPLRYEKKILKGKNYEAVIYAAGPLAFRPAHCSPDTHY